MDTREIAILKQRYNDTLARYNKAETYYAGNGNEYTNYQYDKLCEITLELSGLVSMIESKQKQKMTSDEVVRGFEL